MTMQLSGDGTITGLQAGGLPAASILAASIAAGAVTAPKLDGAQSGVLPIFGLRAAVTFTVSGGVCTITSGFNVTSVTYIGVGQYRVNFTTAFAAATYGMVGTCTGLGGASNQTLILAYGGTAARNTGDCLLWTTSGWADGSTAAVLKETTLVTAMFIG